MVARSPSNYNLFYRTQIWLPKILTGQEFGSQISLPEGNLDKKHGGTITMRQPCWTLSTLSYSCYILLERPQLRDHCKETTHIPPCFCWVSWSPVWFINIQGLEWIYLISSEIACIYVYRSYGNLAKNNTFESFGLHKCLGRPSNCAPSPKMLSNI